MTIAHEVCFVDANILEGQLAGEMPPINLVPTAEAIGIAAVPQAALYFAAQEPRPSQIAKAQLDAEDAARAAAHRKDLEKAAELRRQNEQRKEEGS